MTSYKWLAREAVEAMHEEQLRENGGLSGLKDENALEAALARPLHKHAYGEADVFVLAAAYLYGITRNHLFSDGNKRTGLLAAFTFVFIKGWLLNAEEAMTVELVLGVASGDIAEDGIASFLNDYCISLPA